MKALNLATMVAMALSTGAAMAQDKKDSNAKPKMEKCYGVSWRAKMIVRQVRARVVQARLKPITRAMPGNSCQLAAARA